MYLNETNSTNVLSYLKYWNTWHFCGTTFYKSRKTIPPHYLAEGHQKQRCSIMSYIAHTINFLVDHNEYVEVSTSNLKSTT